MKLVEQLISVNLVTRNTFIFGSPVNSRSSSQWFSLVVETWIRAVFWGGQQQLSGAAAERGSSALAEPGDQRGRKRTLPVTHPPSDSQTTPPTGQALQRK